MIFKRKRIVKNIEEIPLEELENENNENGKTLIFECLAAPSR